MKVKIRYRKIALVGIVLYGFGSLTLVYGGSPNGDAEKFKYIYESYFPDHKEVCKSESVKTYTGSESCKSCHQKQYKTWRKYHMSKFVRLKKDARYIPSFRGLSSWYKSKRDDIALTVGGRNHIAVVIKPWSVFPYQYNVKWRGKKSRTWKYRPGWGHASDYRVSCGRCHLTGLDAGTLEFSELGVGCEACHGSGKRHLNEPVKETIRTPEGQKVCEKCHFQRAKHMSRFRFSGTFHR